MFLEHERYLIEQSKSDLSALKELYAHYFPKIYAYVAYRVRMKQDAEDVVSEVFLKVAELIYKFEYRGENTFAAWLFRIAYLKVSEFRRQKMVIRTAIALEALPDIQSDELLPTQMVLRKEHFAHLSQLIENLPPRRQEIITLKYFGGLRNQEIAEILGVDERTVASNLSRGLKQLQEKYLESEHRE